jgi:hypothetical protein
MNTKKLLTILLTLGFVAMFVVAPVALAASAPDPTEGLTQVGQGFGQTANPESLPLTIGRLIGQVLGLLGIIIVVLMVYGGFLWMTAGGNTAQVDKAKQILINATIGLIITMAAYSISYFVISAVTSATTGS